MNALLRSRNPFAIVLFLGTMLGAQVAVNDRFDRANGTNLGADWIEDDGNSVIQSNRLQGANQFSFGWCHQTVFSANYAGTVVRADWSMNGLGGDSVSLIAGVNPTSWAGIEARIADNNGDGLADRIFFNAAVNAGNWYGGPIFFNIPAPLASGRATLWFTNGGNTANLQIVNLTTLVATTFSANGILALPPTGVRVGVGSFGDGWVDDFRAWTGTPTGPVYTSNPPRGGQPLTLLVSEAAPLGSVLMAFSLAGAGPIPSPLGNIFLSDPINLLPVLPVDAQGKSGVTIPSFPTGITGVTFYNQAVDLLAPALTNAFAMTVL